MRVPYRVEEASEDPERAKTRVIWDLNEDETRRWFENVQKNCGGNENEPFGLLLDGESVAMWDPWDGDEPPTDSDHVAVAISDGDGHTVAVTDDSAGDDQEHDTKPVTSSVLMIAMKNLAYRRYSIAEYFSSTMGMWVPVRIFQIKAFKQKLEEGGHAVGVSYAVKVEGTDQLRHGVALDELRRPLENGDRVEVFVDKRGRTPAMWLPGNISGSTEGGTLFGYRVTLDETSLFTDVHSHTVQALRVRRRFEVGTQIDVYFGLAKGWLPGIVLSLEEPCLEESAAEALKSIDPTMTWERTRKHAIESVRKSGQKTMQDSERTRHWMQKGSLQTVGDEWEAWPLLKVQVYLKRAVEGPQEPDAKQPMPTPEPSAPTTEEPAPAGEQPSPAGEQPTIIPEPKYDKSQEAATLDKVLVVPAFLLRRQAPCQPQTISI